MTGVHESRLTLPLDTSTGEGLDHLSVFEVEVYLYGCINGSFTTGHLADCTQWQVLPPRLKVQ